MTEPRRRLAACALLLTSLALSGCGSAPPVEAAAPPKVQPMPVTEARRAPPAETPPPVADPAPLADIDPASNIFFTLGSSTPGHGEREKLRRAATRLKENENLRITLIGHADGNGSSSLNLAVADARVETVSAMLKRLGARAYQITKSAVGGEKPLSNCRSTECRRKMRRVELRFSDEN